MLFLVLLLMRAVNNQISVSLQVQIYPVVKEISKSTDYHITLNLQVNS